MRGKELVVFLYAAFDYFNEHLFEKALPVAGEGKGKTTIHVKFEMKGCGWARRRDEGATCELQISLNPDYEDRGARFLLSTMVHEMCHLDVWRKSQGGHDWVWRAAMDHLGFDTKEGNGWETERPGEAFSVAASTFIRWWETDGGREEAMAEYAGVSVSRRSSGSPGRASAPASARGEGSSVAAPVGIGAVLVMGALILLP